MILPSWKNISNTLLQLTALGCLGFGANLPSVWAAQPTMAIFNADPAASNGSYCGPAGSPPFELFDPEPKQPVLRIENHSDADLPIAFESAMTAAVTPDFPVLSNTERAWKMTTAGRAVYLRLPTAGAEMRFKVSSGCILVYVVDETNFGHIDFLAQSNAACVLSLQQELQDLQVVVQSELPLTNNPGMKDLDTRARAFADSLSAQQGTSDFRAIRSDACQLLDQTYRATFQKSANKASALATAYAMWNVIPRPILERAIESRLEAIQRSCDEIVTLAAPPRVQAAAKRLADHAERLRFACPRPRICDFCSLSDEVLDQEAVMAHTAAPLSEPIRRKVVDIWNRIHTFHPARIQQAYLDKFERNHCIVDSGCSPDNRVFPNCASASGLTNGAWPEVAPNVPDSLPPKREPASLE